MPNQPLGLVGFVGVAWSFGGAWGFGGGCWVPGCMDGVGLVSGLCGWGLGVHDGGLRVGVQLLVAIFWVSSCACVLSLWLTTVLWGPLLCIPRMILPVPLRIPCALRSSAVRVCL